MKNYKVWECKIIVPEDAELPRGFDWPPRSAAISAIEAAGIPVLGCASGWGASLSPKEKEAFEQHCGEYYFAGLVDTPEDTAH